MRIWAGSTAVRRPGWRFRFDHREKQMVQGSAHHPLQIIAGNGGTKLDPTLGLSVSYSKGRVERANKTLQDRLVKELRLQGVSTIASGNQLLPGFLADYNARFGKEPHNPKNLHRPLSADDDLA